MADRALALPVLLLAATLLAGCAQEPPAAPTTEPAPADPAAATPPEDAIPAGELTPERGQSLFEQAIMEKPDRMGVEMKAVLNGSEVLALRGFADNTTGVTWFRFSMDPAAMDPEGAEEMAAAADVLRQGMEIYVGPEGGLYLINDTALVFPPDEDRRASFLPPPEESPFMEFFNMTDFSKDGEEDEKEDDMRVERIAPTTHRGRAAVQLDISNATTKGTAILYVSPPRIAHVKMTIPEGEAMGGAEVTMDFLYDKDVPTSGPPAVVRALGLAYKSDIEREGAMWGDEGGTYNTTWTFLASGGIPLDEVEVQVKDRGEDAESLADMPTRWSMRLSEGTRSEDGVTVAFTDADGDGKVSKGDVLRVTLPNEGESPVLALKDLKTGTYVTPGPAPLLGLLAVALAGLVLRRRA